MQTLLVIALSLLALIVAFFDVREVFIAWYSETSTLSKTNFTLMVTQVLLCAGIVITSVMRLLVEW